MRKIAFKMKDNKLHIMIDQKISNKEFLLSFKERIEKLFVLRNGINNEVILNLGERKLSDREILELFDILNENEVFYLTKVICKNTSKDSMIIYKGSLRGGQARRFDKSLLLVGSLNKGAKIVVNGDLYVLGKIRGDIELKDKQCKVYCESINNSLIKIGDVYKLYSEELVSKEIYLEQGKILERDYIRGEINNVKSNSCYIG